MNGHNQLLSLALITLTSSLGAWISPLASQTLAPTLKLQKGIQIKLQAKINPNLGINRITPQAMEQAKLVLEKRISGLGISGAVVTIDDNNQLLVKLPRVNDPNLASRVISTTGQLDFRKQKRGTESELRAKLQVLHVAKVQRESLRKSGDHKAIAENETTYKKSIEDLKNIFESTGLMGNMLKEAVASPLDGSSGAWKIALTFDAQGSDLFAKVTGEIAGTGRAVGIFLDDQLISFPSVGSEFKGKGITGGRAVITGNFTSEAANELALQIRSGALPIHLEIIDSLSF